MVFISACDRGCESITCSLKVVALPQRRVTPVGLRNNPFLHLHIHSLKYTSVGRQRTNKNNIQTANQREREWEWDKETETGERETSLSLYKRCQCHTPVLSWASCQTPVSVETVPVSDRWQDGCQHGRDGVRVVGSYQTVWIVRVCVCVLFRL